MGVAMTSNLKWRMGFGWGATLCLAGSMALAVFASGLLRLAGVAGVIIAGIFSIFQYKKWNSKGWRQIHFRAMLAYARCAGEESAEAQQQGRQFNRANSCRNLGIAISGWDRAANVEAMVLALEQEKGDYLARLIETNAEKLLPQLSPTELSEITNQLRRFELGPELVVANIVENTFGSMEAACYALALLTREAH
jgi:hypothetical protein